VQTELSVSTAVVAILAPADCLSVRIQQKQGSDPPQPTFSIYAADGVTLLSTQQGGTNYEFNAPQGGKFTSGQVVGYTKIPTGTVVFVVFAEPVVAGLSLPSGTGSFTTTVLTSAQLLALQTTPIQLAAAPGPGKFLVPKRLVLQFKKKVTAYTLGNADNALTMEYTGKSTAIVAPAAAGLVDQAADTVMYQEEAVALAAISRANVENLGLELKLTGTTPALTLGDGTLIATLFYDTLSLQ
jgi:hypothetical protein